MINFGTGKLICTPTNLSDGSAIANPTPVVLASLQDISVDLSVEIKPLHGSGRYPIAAGQGKGKSEIKAKYADVNGAILGSLFFGKAATAGIKGAVLDFATSIPATPFTVTVVPPASGTFVADLGVVRTDTGQQLTRVASAPATGQYSVSAVGLYTFAAADTGKPVAISYEYSASSTTGQIFNLTNDQMGYTPSFSMLLQNQYDGKTMVLKFNRCVSGKLSVPLKNDDFAMYDFEAEAFADAAGSLGYICLF
jgi:hypothetical protein